MTRPDESPTDRPIEDELLNLLDGLDDVLDSKELTAAEIASAKPIPLSEGFKPPPLAELRALRAGSANARRRPRMSWLSAAALAIAAVFACGPLVVQWVGRESSDLLLFEHSIRIARDRDDVYGFENRMSALGAVTSRIRVAIDTLRQRQDIDVSLREPITAVFESIRATCRAPESAIGQRFDPGRFEQIVWTIKHSNSPDVAVVLDDFAAAVESGIQVLHSLRGEGDQFERRYRIQLRNIEGRLPPP